MVTSVRTKWAFPYRGGTSTCLLFVSDSTNDSHWPKSLESPAPNLSEKTGGDEARRPGIDRR